MFARAYVRRKRFEARLIAEEVAALFSERQPDAANPSTPSPPTPRPSEAPASVPPSVLLRTMGITF